ncbi:acyl-CoA carboxylase subunit epsilon [Frigoribacterium sp. CFBP 13712]|nr:acyl-CoA carboxylase subunit epsilon [Frigoribacterium sp. CFBP 13712]MBD8702494.1 acyl-CoA carboxylase subunit epsilon [Frigoribacterium sp. CFBP 13712]
MLTIVSGRPTDDELAAITAVLAAGEAAAAAEQATLLVPQPESAWTRSRRRPRGPLTVGPGHWRSFSG